MENLTIDNSRLSFSNQRIRFLIRLYSFGALAADSKLRIHPLSMARLLFFCALLPAAQIIGSYKDGALILPGDDKGLLEHYGQWSVFVAPPLLISIAVAALRKLMIAMQDMPQFSIHGYVPPSVEAVIKRYRSYLELKGGARIALFVLVAAGTIVVIINFYQTIHPVDAFGNDTFDSIKHRWGFLFTRISNTILYAAVFPALILEVALITLALVKILEAMVAEKVLHVDFFASDECGGMSDFGSINVLIMLFWFVIFGIIVADFVVQTVVAHTLIASAIFCSFLFLGQSIWGVYAIHKCIKKRKEEALEKINSELNSIFLGKNALEKLVPIMQLRETIRSTKTLPYTSRAKIIVNVMRFAPTAAALIRIVA